MNQEQQRALFRLYVETGNILEDWPVGHELHLHLLTWQLHRDLGKTLASLGVIAKENFTAFG